MLSISSHNGQVPPSGHGAGATAPGGVRRDDQTFANEIATRLGPQVQRPQDGFVASDELKSENAASKAAEAVGALGGARQVSTTDRVSQMGETERNGIGDPRSRGQVRVQGQEAPQTQEVQQAPQTQPADPQDGPTHGERRRAPEVSSAAYLQNLVATFGAFNQ